MNSCISQLSVGTQPSPKKRNLVPKTSKKSPGPHDKATSSTLVRGKGLWGLPLPSSTNFFSGEALRPAEKRLKNGHGQKLRFEPEFVSRCRPPAATLLYRPARAGLLLHLLWNPPSPAGVSNPPHPAPLARGEPISAIIRRVTPPVETAELDFQTPGSRFFARGPRRLGTECI